jgi:hypothetical protein
MEILADAGHHHTSNASLQVEWWITNIASKNWNAKISNFRVMIEYNLRGQTLTVYLHTSISWSWIDSYQVKQTEITLSFPGFGPIHSHQIFIDPLNFWFSSHLSMLYNSCTHLGLYYWFSHILFRCHYRCAGVIIIKSKCPSSTLSHQEFQLNHSMLYQLLLSLDWRSTICRWNSPTDFGHVLHTAEVNYYQIPSWASQIVQFYWMTNFAQWYLCLLN